MSYIDDYIKHILGTNFYADELLSLSMPEVDSAIRELNFLLQSEKHCVTKKECKELKTQILIILADLEIKLNSIANDITDMAIAEENSWLEEHICKALGVSFNFPVRLKSLIKEYPFATAGAIAVFGTLIADKMRSTYENLVNTSYVMGLDFEDELEDNEMRFNSIKNMVKSNSETIGSNIVNSYDRLVFTKNDSVIKGYVWSAILDTSTCLACGALSGKKFKSLAEAPINPLHQNCRCILIPYTENIQKDIPESYSSWFENQDEETKKNILGPSRYDLYKDGMKIDHFSKNGKIFTLKNLLTNKN